MPDEPASACEAGALFPATVEGLFDAIPEISQYCRSDGGRRLYDDLVKDYVVELSMHDVGTRVIQELLSCAHNPARGMIVQELLPSEGSRRGGVV